MKTAPPQPNIRHLVLLGGGHAHVFVLEAFAKRPEPGVKITLVAKEAYAPYSGMLPGLIAGRYSHAECHIDLNRLCQRAGATLIHAPAEAIDVATRKVSIPGHPRLTYDVLSLDVGSTPSLGLVTSTARHAIAVKPISEFAPKWQALEERAATSGRFNSLAVIGTGAAGFELALAARARLNALASKNGTTAPQIALIGSGELLEGVNTSAQRRARAALAKRNVALIEHDGASAIGPDTVKLMSGRIVPADAVLVATGSSAPTTIAAPRLARDPGGYFAVEATLQVCKQNVIFAAGDCAAVVLFPRPKAGVFAVRQGPVLAANIRHVLRGDTARPFVPQSQFLTLLSLGDGTAIAARGPFAAEGRWVWRWKDRIDRKFVHRFNTV